MAVKGKELIVFLLDVGPSMHPHLEHAGRALFTFLEAKVRSMETGGAARCRSLPAAHAYRPPPPPPQILNKPMHEVALVMFGTTGARPPACLPASACTSLDQGTSPARRPPPPPPPPRAAACPTCWPAGTSNAVHDEMVAEGEGEGAAGAADLYTHITVAQPLMCPHTGHLLAANAVAGGEGRQDYYEAATVALDVLIKAVQERHLDKMATRLVVLSDFEAPQVSTAARGRPPGVPAQGARGKGNAAGCWQGHGTRRGEGRGAACSWKRCWNRPCSRSGCRKGCSSNAASCRRPLPLAPCPLPLPLPVPYDAGCCQVPQEAHAAPDPAGRAPPSPPRPPWVHVPSPPPSPFCPPPTHRHRHPRPTLSAMRTTWR
jgi:hypothetical protein